MKYLILFILLVFITLITTKYFKSLIKENFIIGKKYNIKYNNGKKEIELYNIVSKAVSDKINGFRFDGKSSYINIPDMNKNKYTLTFLVSFNNIQKNQNLVYSKYRLYIENSTLYVSYNNEKFLIEKKIKSNEFIHIALIVNNKDITLFLDGVKTTKTFKNQFKDNNIILGKNNTDTKFFKGIIGEIQLYSENLSINELCDMYDACNLSDCAFISNGKTREECYKNCMESEDTDCNRDSCVNKCFNVETSTWKPPCEFKPYGDDIFNCIDHCSKKNSCNYSDCTDICKECKDSDICPWAQVSEEIEPNPYKSDLLYDPKGAPLAPKIQVKTYNGKVLISWNKSKRYILEPITTTTIANNNDNSIPSTTKNNEPKKILVDDNTIIAYVCIIYKTLSKKEGIDMSLVPYPNCKKCSYVIDNLDENTYYSVGIRAYNKEGLSRISNIISFIPKFKMKPLNNSINPINNGEDERPIIEYCDNK